MHRMSIILSLGTFQLETVILAVISKTDLTSKSLSSSWISLGYRLYLQRESPLWKKICMIYVDVWLKILHFLNGIYTIYIVCTMLVLFGLSGSSIYAYKHLSYCELWRDKFLWFTASLLGVFFLAYQLLSYLSRRIICLSRFLNLSSLQRKLIFFPFLTP